jgi:hypothetical protein
VPGKINVFNLGDLGVDIVKSPLHIPDGAWRKLQNAEFGSNKGQHAIKKRGALLRINSVALAGSPLSFSNVPIAYPGTKTLLVGMNDGATEGWRSSTDAADFTATVSASHLQRPSGHVDVTAIFSTLSASSFYMGQKPVTFKNRFFYAGDNYVPGTSAPPVVMYDGQSQFEMFRIPTNPTSTAGTVPTWIPHMVVWNGIIYMCVLDEGGAVPNVKGRVLAFDPSNGAVSLVGNRFGDDTGENGRGYPHCLAVYNGELYCGSNAISGSSGQMGSVWRINPLTDTVWTEDKQIAGGNNGVMSMAVYNGNLYASLAAGVGTAALVLKRDSVGTWTTSYTPSDTGVSYTGALIVFNSNLYAVNFKAGSGAVTLILKFDDSSWSTAKDFGADVVTDISPGDPTIFNDILLFSFFPPTSDSATTGHLWSLNTSDVFAAELTSVGLRGVMGSFVPESTPSGGGTPPASSGFSSGFSNGFGS